MTRDFVTREGGTRFPQASRPFNDASLDMGVPPSSRRLYGRSGRAALTAGTLTPVGDNTARQDVHGNVEVRDFDGYYPDVMPTDHEPREWYDEAESLRQSRLRSWQTIR